MMKKTNLKFLFMLLSAGYITNVLAHTQNGSLGSEAGAVDFYRVACSTEGVATDFLELKVLNSTSSSPLISVQTQIDLLAANTTDPDSGGSSFSPVSEVHGGNGVYFVTVTKTGVGSANYTIDYHCLNGAIHTATDITQLQNEFTSPPEGGGTGDVAFEPTTIADSSLDEGQRIYTAATISHGCQDPSDLEKSLQVTAQSIVFPNDLNLEARDDAENPIDITGVFEGGFDLGPRMLQDKSIFKKQSVIRDVSDSRVAFHYTGGKLQTDAIGWVPIRVTAPNFNEFLDAPTNTVPNCVKQVTARLGIANYCNKSKNTNKDNRADIWIGQTTATFSDPDVVSEGFWPTITVQRDLAAKPLAGSCGGGDDISVQPSDAAIDEFLRVKGYWPYKK